MILYRFRKFHIIQLKSYRKHYQPYWQVGLAVGDIQGLQENASLQKLRIQVVLNLRVFIMKHWILRNPCTVYVVYLMKITGQYFMFLVDIL